MFLTALLATLGGVVRGQDVLITVDELSRRARGVEFDGESYFPLADIIGDMGLETQETGSTIEISGPRGRIVLTDGRPLVRFEGQYVLLAAPVRRRAPGDWLVPEDLILKGLGLILESRIEQVGPSRYRVERTGRNEVLVEVANFPDRVSIMFLPSRTTEITVREETQQIRVQFERYPVRPQLPVARPDEAVVSALRFDSADAMGAFQIVKGPLFGSFRSYQLASPLRQVVDVYRVGAGAVEESPVGGVPGIRGPGSVPDLKEGEATGPLFVVIDPGHGGVETGAASTQELLEKNVTLQLAQELETILRGKRISARMTRDRDLEMTLEQRSAAANAQTSKVFVSLHVGESPSEATKGPVVYVHKYLVERPLDPELPAWSAGQREVLADSRRLAERLQEALNAVFTAENKVSEAPLAVLAPARVPSVLIECGFVTNPDDLAKLSDPLFRRRLAEALALGLERFLR